MHSSPHVWWRFLPEHFLELVQYCLQWIEQEPNRWPLYLESNTLPVDFSLFKLLTDIILIDNWRAPWKNWISSTTMKLRESLVKPVMWQNISSCLVLPPEIIMHDAFNVILWTSADICVVVHDDLGWKNRTTRCNRFWRAGCSQLEYVDIRLVY